MSVLSVVDELLAVLRGPKGNVSMASVAKNVISDNFGMFLQVDGRSSDLPLALLQMKILNRKTMLQLERKEADVNEQKEKNDSNRLRLENLLYRKAYLAREIKACKDFMPSEVASVEVEVGHPLVHDTFSLDLPQKHRSSLIALASEYQERQRVQELLAKLKDQHVIETGALDKKMKFLEELPGKLDVLLKGASELEDVILPQEKISMRDANIQRAQRLPGPLYVLYHSLHNVKAAVGGESGLCSPGFSLLLSRPAGPNCNYSTKWMYKIEIVEGTDGSSAELNLHLRIEVDVPSTSGGIPETESSFMVLQFSCDDMGSSKQVGVAVLSLSYQNRCPFKLEGILHALYPHDEGETETLAKMVAGASSKLCVSFFLWAQWLSGLRPVPESPDVSVSNSSGAVLHRVS